MKIGVACGGTGGHLFPGMAVASELRRRGHEVVLWLDPRSVEHARGSGWSGQIVTVKSSGFPSGFSLRVVTVAARLLWAAIVCVRAMRGSRPDVLLAMGSYASFGPVLAAWLRRIPVVLHEANAVPGRVVSLLAPCASVVAITFEASRGFLRGRTELTGFPVWHDLTPRFEKCETCGLARDRFTVLIMGGSQGAHVLNERGAAAVCRLQASGAAVQVVHLTGAADEDMVRRTYRAAGVPHRVYPFLKDMEKAYGAADIAVCRAGAATCMELVALGVPALLVPLPLARRDHQTSNAKVLVDAGAAELKPQQELTAAWLSAYLAEVGQTPGKLERMRDAAARMAVPHADRKIADLVEGAAREA